jgi:hypothetical protein
VTRIGELGKNSAVTSNRLVPSSLILATLMMEALSSSKKSVLIRVTRRNVPEDAILHVKSSHERCKYSKGFEYFLKAKPGI